MKNEWFRNTDWNPEIELFFFDKLGRARDKAQYLRLQAYTLARTHPSVALRLLEQYFELGQRDFALAQAYVDQATAYESMGEIELAVRSYELALDREEEFPHSLTQAYLELPSLIFNRKLKVRYEKALRILKKYLTRPKFPVEHFQWHAVFALISQELCQNDLARIHARQALESAGRTHSGFRNHPKLGLVGDHQDLIRRKLEEILLVG